MTHHHLILITAVHTLLKNRHNSANPDQDLLKNQLTVPYEEYCVLQNMNDCLAKDGDSLTKKQKVKFVGESESERGPDDDGSKGWLLGDYKVGDINFAIASVTDERQVKKYEMFQTL